MSQLVEEVVRLERIEHEARYQRQVLHGVLETLAKGIPDGDSLQAIRVDLMTARTSLDLVLKED